jgi:hypothetical protein
MLWPNSLLPELLRIWCIRTQPGPTPRRHAPSRSWCTRLWDCPAVLTMQTPCTHTQWPPNVTVASVIVTALTVLCEAWGPATAPSPKWKNEEQWSFQSTTLVLKDQGMQNVWVSALCPGCRPQGQGIIRPHWSLLYWQKGKGRSRTEGAGPRTLSPLRPASLGLVPEV